MNFDLKKDKSMPGKIRDDVNCKKKQEKTTGAARPPRAASGCRRGAASGLLLFLLHHTSCHTRRASCCASLGERDVLLGPVGDQVQASRAAAAIGRPACRKCCGDCCRLGLPALCRRG